MWPFSLLIKRSFWVARSQLFHQGQWIWTLMKNCRSLFAWQCAPLKESAMGRVVERQVLTPELPGHVVLAPSTASSLLFPGLPSGFDLRLYRSTGLKAWTFIRQVCPT